MPSKKTLKKPSPKPRKNIVKSNIQKQNVKQVVNVHLPSKSRTYKRSSDGKTVTKTIVQPMPSMIQPIYVPQPSPYNFSNVHEPVSSSIEKLLNRIQTKPYVKEEEKDDEKVIKGFDDIFKKDKNETFINYLENKQIIDKVDEIRPIEIDQDLFKKFEQQNKMFDVLDEIKSNKENKLMGQEDIRYEEPIEETIEKPIESKKYKKTYEKEKQAYEIYQMSGGEKTLEDLRKEPRPKGMTKYDYILYKTERLLSGEPEDIVEKKKSGRPRTLKKEKEIIV